MITADEYNERQLATRKLLPSDVTKLVRYWQVGHQLEPDGQAGPKTIASLVGPRQGWPRCYPLRALADGRKPQITSGHATVNPSRPTHRGVDLFYPREAGDPAMPIGDGGRERDWWIPDGTIAIAAVAGVVTRAGPSATGYHAWIAIDDEWRIGYFHLSRLDVQIGQRVELGAPIGVVGDNPKDRDARHLHFELYRGGLSSYPAGTCDPAPLLAGALILPALL